MKCVILAGGYGSRISEETHDKPKPMVEIGNKPIIWHIMKYYYHFGVKEFIICLGYKSEVIKKFFIDYYIYNSDIEINPYLKEFNFLKNNSEDWTIKLIETGKNSLTGGRIKNIKKYIEEDEDFFMTYGDGLSNVDLNKLLKLHQKNKFIATLTSISQYQKFGKLKINKNKVLNFYEKPKEDFKINGGFFVLNSKIFNYIKSNMTVFEKEPLERLASIGKLGAHHHNGFWQCMDSLRDKQSLELVWQKNPPWKIW